MTVLAAAPVTSCRDVPWSRARELAHAAPTPLSAGRVPLTRAAGLTLAEDLCARQPLPPFDTAAMDGYAIAGPGPWLLSADVVRAGAVDVPEEMAEGEAVEISTGAQVPCGAEAVLPQEHAVRAGAGVRGPAPVSGKHIRRAGEDASVGACLAPAGTRVGPALLGLAAACGYDTLLVRPRPRPRPRPRVRILVTGDELIHAGRPATGQIRDALGPLLPPLVNTLGGEATDVRPVPDHPVGALATAVLATSYDTDVIVVTGSTSVGATDQLRRLPAEHGARWVVDAVACRPGHPQLLAQLPDRRWTVGLPGNPYAALTAVHTLLAPLLAGLTGRPLPALPHVPLTGGILVVSFSGGSGLRRRTGGGCVCEPLAGRAQSMAVVHVGGGRLRPQEHGHAIGALVNASRGHSRVGPLAVVARGIGVRYEVEHPCVLPGKPGVGVGVGEPHVDEVRVVPGCSAEIGSVPVLVGAAVAHVRSQRLDGVISVQRIRPGPE
ncbi:molybdopterin molybdotransferase MoeA [Streptomyces sp. NPDC004732]|uniref:molybdopterin molybdotransferase MoeA n=1 Tax=Streptomyces sp. NPDC004732 TaxID=3154290 RepID=UPI0033A18FD0